jgi:hypothetical protein
MLVQDQGVVSMSTPDRVESRLGRLEFRDGAPIGDTAERLFDHLIFMRGVDAFLNSFQVASIRALRQAFLDVGVRDNEVLMFSELMDSRSIFLTANADTVYFISFIDLTAGPMVLDAPPETLGVIDDMWFRWVTDFGIPGPDRGEGGRYLLLPPGYDGSVPDGGFNVSRVRTNRVCMLGRSFLVDDDPAPVVATIKQTMRIYPYVPGAAGTSIATLLTGAVPMAASTPPPPLVYHEGTGLELNTVAPNDERFFEVMNDAIQDEPAEAGDPEITGQLEAIGIVRGKAFSPDQRTRRLLADAVAVANATARSLVFHPREDEGFGYYDARSAWSNSLFLGGYDFMTPPPRVTQEGIRPFPPTGSRKLNSRTSFFYYATGDTPAMCMRLPGVGSQYLWATTDGDGAYLDGAEYYTLTLPDGIPAARFWSVTVYDNQTRSMLQTDQRFPRAGSQSYPTPAAIGGDDGATTIHFGPERPAGVAEGNWIQTVPGKGWNVILRLYSPLPSFFDKSWRPGELTHVPAGVAS